MIVEIAAQRPSATSPPKREGTQDNYRRGFEIVRHHRSTPKASLVDPVLIRDLKRSNVAHFCGEVAERHGLARADQVLRQTSLRCKFALKKRECTIDEDCSNPPHGIEAHYKEPKYPHLVWAPHLQKRFLDSANDRERLAFFLARLHRAPPQRRLQAQVEPV